MCSERVRAPTVMVHPFGIYMFFIVGDQNEVTSGELAAPDESILSLSHTIQLDVL